MNSYKFVTESWVNGTSWYRIWSDKWIEQGGQMSLPETSSTAVTLHKTMANTNYYCSAIQTNVSTVGDTEMGIGCSPTSASQINIFCHYINPNTATVRWEVKGFMA